ncbi:MAG: nucleotidyltransferase domain-containing protein [Bacteroidales bacterium]|jgi:hypothetical protein
MKTLNKNIIISTIIAEKQNIKKFGINEIGLFGSFAKDKQTSKSDIDILVSFDSDKETFDNFINLCFLFDKLFKGKKVEVVTKNSLSPYISSRILKDIKYVQITD